MYQYLGDSAAEVEGVQEVDQSRNLRIERQK